MAGLFQEVGDLGELHDGAVSSAKGEFAEERDAVEGGTVDLDADRDDAVAFEHGRGGLTQHSSVERGGDVRGGEAEALGINGAHAETQGRAGGDEAVVGVHDTGDLLQLLLNFRRFLSQKFDVR